MRIVILHGWGHCASHWRSAVDALSHFGAVEAWDLPGFGDEPMVSSAWGVEEYAVWVEQKIGDAHDVVLVGHSFGGRIAACIASHRPNWLRALVLIGAPCVYRPTIVIRAKSCLAHLVKPIVPATIRRRLLDAELREAEDGRIGNVFRNAVLNDQTVSLPMISVPTLLLWGEHDDAVPLPIAQEIHTLIPQSSLVILPGIGHNVHIDNPTLTYGAITRFLETL